MRGLPVERTKDMSRIALTLGLAFAVLSVLLPLWDLSQGDGYTPQWGYLTGGAFVVVWGMCLRGSPRPRLGRWIVAAGLGWVMAVLVFSAIDAARRGEFSFYMSLPSLTGGVGVALIGGCMARRDDRQGRSPRLP